MAKVIATIKAIITRLIFSAHGFLAIWQVAQSKKDPIYWALCAPIGLLLFEAIFTLTIKKSQEWRWFCPSVFLYLISVVPAIWLLELDKMERRMKKFLGEDAAMRPPDFKNLDKILGNQFKIPEIKVDTSTWITLIEQFLMLILIIGRWMLPKGDLTRDQLSQLLLVYIGTAADIIEFFDSFKDNTIANDKLLVFLTLAIWSWSLLQFTIVLSSTRARKPRGAASSSYNQNEITNCCCNIDACGIFLNIMLQDAPFLAFRLLIIIHYKIISYMNVFFTCKNTLVILLQLYRLSVVHSESRKAKRLKLIQAMEEGRDIFIVSNEMNNGKKKSHRKKKEIAESEVQKPSKHQKKKHISAGKKDTGYSTASSSSESESSDEIVEKRSKSQKKKDMGKRKKKSDRSKSKKKKVIEERVSEEGSNSEAVEEVKEKKSKKKHRKSSTSSSSSSE